ncbi:hypothetical protein H5410_031847 [Solanum commersonii]|uniref:Purine transporter n=1 Tax=Solanum commersonii TaxID=4109 RepID=A0A9J5YKE3_SOLCO|nr:hypothetical protein H5410_031847 [Solanum commersonii]
MLYFDGFKGLDGKVISKRVHNTNSYKYKDYILLLATIGIGILQGLSNYSYSNGIAKLPVSTNGLLTSTQLAFFAFIIVRLKLTSYSINSVFLLTIGAVVLALHSGGDRPEGETNKEYILGFVMSLAAAALTGIIFPLVELIYKKAQQAITYTFVLEFQSVYCYFLLPVTEVLAVILYGEKFNAEKGISLWGFTSYFYGDYKDNKKRESSNQSLETETIDKTKCTPARD